MKANYNNRYSKRKYAITDFPEYAYFKESPLYQMIALHQGDPEIDAFLQVFYNAMGQSSDGQIPNHSTFRRMLQPYCGAKPQGNTTDYTIFADSDLGGKATPQHLLPVFGALYHEVMQQISSAEPDESDMRKAREVFGIWNRYKLLIGLFENKERAVHLFETVAESVQNTSAEAMELDCDATAQDILYHLTVALKNDLQDDANRLAGMLMMKKASLDPGEYAYVSALVYMKSADRVSIDKALMEIGKIPEDAPDYKKSRGMLAEIYARKGDMDRFADTVEKYGAWIDGQAAMYYLQLLIKNTAFFSQGEGRGEAENQKLSDKLSDVLDRIAVVYPETILFDGSSATEILFRANALEAAQAVYRFYEDTQDIDDAGIVPAVVVRSLFLLMSTAGQPITEELTALLDDGSAEKRKAFVYTYFAPRGNQKKEYEIFLSAAQTFFDEAEYVNVFLENKAALQMALGSSYAQFLTSVYYAALYADHTKAETICEELCAMNPDFAKTNQEDIAFQQVCGMLRPENKILYSSAESQFRTAMAEDYGWKDAGMLSLNYFRILEREFRTIFFEGPLADQGERILRMVEKTKQYQKKRGHLLVRRTDTDRTFDLDRSLCCLKKPSKLTMEKMEYLFVLLSDRAIVDAVWKADIDYLRACVEKGLSDEGKAALHSNAIASVIGYDKRNEYRNPPAHANYLPIEKACECREYTNQSLKTLYEKWLRAE